MATSNRKSKLVPKGKDILVQRTKTVSDLSCSKIVKVYIHTINRCILQLMMTLLEVETLDLSIYLYRQSVPTVADDDLC